ncbi:MAG: RidA family protein [Rhodoferax sp.]|nr:RidA family protein [Rhodoferax sp.]
MAQPRWQQLTRTLDTEIDLVAAQLTAAPAAPAAPVEQPATRRRISSGSPWEALAGYSRAVVDGDWIFVSGTVGQDFATLVMPDSAAAQTQLALDTIARALREADANLDDVVQVRVYIPHREDVAAVSGVLKERLGAARPTNTTVCSPLALDGARVELEVTARRIRPSPPPIP